jgi:23S rRNA pseudouridine955/2504/2580 synthase
MNTGGLVMVAKNKKALEDAVALFKDNLITKRYRAIVLGTPDEGEPVVYDDGTVMYEIKAFLEKTRSGEVYIHDEKQPHDLPVTTRYRVVKTYKPQMPGIPVISEIECELVTGRTHQIRAQFAHLGYPVIGDGNYGRNKINTGFKAAGGAKLRHQQLYSTEITAGRVPSGNMHADISGKTFKIAPEYELDFGSLGIKR